MRIYHLHILVCMLIKAGMLRHMDGKLLSQKSVAAVRDGLRGLFFYTNFWYEKYDKFHFVTKTFLLTALAVFCH